MSRHRHRPRPAVRRVALILPLLAGACLSARLAPAAGPEPRVACSAQGGAAALRLRGAQPGEFVVAGIVPVWRGTAPRGVQCRVVRQGAALHLRYRWAGGSATLVLMPGREGCRLTAGEGGDRIAGVGGQVGGKGEVLTCRVVMEGARPKPYVRDDVFEIGFGRASNRRMNAVYSRDTFWGVHFGVPEGATPDLRPAARGYTFRAPLPLHVRVVDLWPIVGRREGQGFTFGREHKDNSYLVPRAWLKDRRPFPWQPFSPVQLPFVSLSDPKDWEETARQIDFLARELRDYGFSCYGEWPLTQYYPEYDPVLQPAWLEGNRRSCDYAHARGIKILRWLTDPDIDAGRYPELHRMMQEKGWFSPSEGEWLLDYSNPEVQEWVAGHYARLAETGPDFYWIDNNHPTRPVRQPDLFAPDAFRLFYGAIQKGLRSTGRQDILIRSGASVWADYTGVGILDVYAPGPDVQNSWIEQQISVATELAHRDYISHYNLWRRSIDDFYPAGPQTIDQTRAMATLIAFTGLGYTTTDIGFPNIPRDRLELVRQTVPIGVMRPLDMYRLPASPLPRVWTVSVQKGSFDWQLLALFNWGTRSEQQHFVSFADLGLDPGREYLVFDFFSQRPVGVFAGGIGCRVAPASARSFSVHPLRDTPFLVSTDRHITQGVVDVDDLRWEPWRGALSGVFTAGVAGRTYHLTLYSPPGWQPTEARVAGQTARLSPAGHGLVRLPLACQGANVPWTVRFRRAAGGATTIARGGMRRFPRAPARPEVHLRATTRRPVNRAWGRSPVHGALLVARRFTSRRGLDTPQAAGTPRVLDLRPPEVLRGASGSALLAAARQGTAVLVVAPDHVSEAVRRLQEAVGLRWGLVREYPGGPAALTVGGSDGESAPGLLFRSACVSYRTNQAAAVCRAVSRGLVVVAAPTTPASDLRRLAVALAKDPKLWLAQARAAQARLANDSTSTFAPWAVDPVKREGRTRVRFSPLLGGKELSFHVSRYLGTSSWEGVPDLEVTLNGRVLEHILNPCRPESPPQLFDAVYFRIPAGAARFAEGNDLAVRIKSPVASPDRLQAQFQDALELRIETPGAIGKTAMGALPPVVVLAEARPRLVVLLGAGGPSGDVVEEQGPGLDYSVTGAAQPFAGWPQGPGRTQHCVFALDGFGLDVKVPKGTAGTLSVYAYDADAYRRQSVRFEKGPARPVERFGDGVWLRFPFTRRESADGLLRLAVRKVHGGNCVLSRLEVTLKDHGR